MAIERERLKSFAYQERSLLSKLAGKRLFSDIGPIFAVLDEIEALLSLKLHLLADQNDGLFGLAWWFVVYSLAGFQALVAL